MSLVTEHGPLQVTLSRLTSGECPLRVKTGKAQCEQMFSAVHSITDIADRLPKRRSPPDPALAPPDQLLHQTAVPATAMCRAFRQRPVSPTRCIPIVVGPASRWRG